MSRILMPSNNQVLHSRNKRRSRGDPPTIHVFNRREIMRKAWQIAREHREEAARRAFDLEARVVGSRIIHARPFSAVLADTPLNLGAAMKDAWTAARKVNDTYRSAALIVVRQSGAVTPLRRLRFVRVLRLMTAVAGWIERRFIPSRAA